LIALYRRSGHHPWGHHGLAPEAGHHKNSQVRKPAPAVAINWTGATPILAFLNTFDHLTFIFVFVYALTSQTTSPYLAAALNSKSASSACPRLK
jgi:hypothetical protein